MSKQSRYKGQPPSDLDLAEWSEVEIWSEGDRVITDSQGPGVVLGPEFILQDDRWVFLRRWAVRLDFAKQFPWFDDGIAYYWDRNLTKEPT